MRRTYRNYRTRGGYRPDSTVATKTMGYNKPKYNIFADTGLTLTYKMRFTETNNFRVTWDAIAPSNPNVWVRTMNMFFNQSAGFADVDLGDLLSTAQYAQQMFQQFKLIALKAEYMPDCTSESAGTVYLGFSARADTGRQSFNTLQEISQMTPLAKGDIKQPLEVIWVPKTNHDKQWRMLQTYSNTGAAPVHQDLYSSYGTLVMGIHGTAGAGGNTFLLNGNPVEPPGTGNAANQNVGTITLTAVIQFCGLRDPNTVTNG